MDETSLGVPKSVGNLKFKYKEISLERVKNVKNTLHRQVPENHHPVFTAVIRSCAATLLQAYFAHRSPRNYVSLQQNCDHKYIIATDFCFFVKKIIICSQLT